MINLLLFLISINMFSQEEKIIESSASQQNTLKYDVKLFFPHMVIHQYRMDEETEVEREYEDGTPYTYKKRQTWYVTFYSPIVGGKDGEKQVYVEIDSIDYEFKDDKYDVEFNNSFDGIPPGHVWDFEKTFFLNAKQFDMYYDAYNKAYKIESENIDAERYSIDEYANKAKDFKSEMLKKRFEDEEFIHVADPVKNLLPPTQMPLDSSWLVDFKFDIDFVTFNNVSSATMTNFLDNHFFIKMNVDTLFCVDTTMLMGNIKKVAKIEAGLANGDVEMKISSKGHVKYLTTKFDAEIYGKVENIKFIEKKKTRVSWNLVGMWHQ